MLRDVGRYARLVDKGWRNYRYRKYEIYREAGKIVDRLTPRQMPLGRPSVAGRGALRRSVDFVVSARSTAGDMTVTGT